MGVVLIFILILCIICLLIYLIVDKKDITSNNNQGKENNINDKITEDIKVELDINKVELDINNENIITLFNNAHPFSIGSAEIIFHDSGYKVSEMSMEEKMNLLGKQWKPLVEEEPSGSDSDTWALYLEEDTLKNIYERTFGPNTYTQVNQISDGCTTLNYDATNKRYSYVGPYGCGGTTTFTVYEKIISATKYSDKIEIVGAAFFEGPDGLYKDYNKSTFLSENTFYANEYTDEQRNNLRNQYIEENKDNLE